jgi:hypothetical protein
MKINSLKRELGLKAGMRTHFSHAPVEYFERLGVRAAPNRGADGDGVYEFIHAFFTEKEQLVASAHILTSKLTDDGILWISYPINSTELTSKDVNEVLKPIGLVEKETIEVINNWLGTKFVL